MIKQSIKTIKEKNTIVSNIIDTIIGKNHFLICGHKNPDEDCIASMVAFAILLTKFDKVPLIYLDNNIPENLQYLLNICKYNSIKLIRSRSRIKESLESVVICDTAKRSMVNLSKKFNALIDNKNIVKIEFDHHIGSDSEYIGDRNYSLVTDASSTCELVGYLALKLRNKKNILKKFLISDPFSRNFVLSILTGILGDTQKGQFLKSRREKKFYDIFSKMYDSVLMTMTVRDSNFTNIEDIFKELQHLNQKEEECYKYINEKQNFSDSLGYIVLDSKDMKFLYKHFDEETLINTTKAIANELAEKSGKISLISYYDKSNKNSLVQFRMRRSHDYTDFDLRRVLDIFNIENGGGHEGAIGFRVPKSEIKELQKYIRDFIERLETEISGDGI